MLISTHFFNLNLCAYGILVATDQFCLRFAQHRFTVVQHRNLFARQCRTDTSEVKVFWNNVFALRRHKQFCGVG